MSSRGEGRREGAGGRGSSRAAMVASAVVASFIIAVMVLASASAQDPLPPIPSTNVNDARAPLDTKYTQVAKDGSALWNQVGGVKFGTSDLVNSSPTPETTDLFSVAFRNGTHGFAGGADCVTPGLTGDALAGCTNRVPVLYEFSDPDGTGGEWTKVTLPGGDKPGFVSSIAFLDDERVLAVGGDGRYPRREDPAATTDQAGKARAWLYEDGQWTELTDLPADMGGLTTVAASPRPSDCGAGANECVFAGGLAAVWRWSDGVFSPATFDDGQGTATQTPPAELEFRVRSLRFMPGSSPQVQGVGVTAGCCSPDQKQFRPRFLTYSSGRWHLAFLTGSPNRDDVKTGSAAVDPQLQEQTSALPYDTAIDTIPDSYYSIAPAGSPPVQLSVVASPGGAADPLEQNSAVLGRLGVPRADYATGALNAAGSPVTGQPDNGDQGTDVAREAVRSVPNGIRLVAGDGDFTGPAWDGLSEQDQLKNNTGGKDYSSKPDGYLDWAVGELTGAVSGDQAGRAVVFSPAMYQDGYTVPDPIDCGGGAVGTSCKTRDPQGLQDKLAGHAAYYLTSYALNAISIPEAGVGWAVGDRGAIEKLGAAAGATATTAPDTPKLGKSEASPLPDTSAYDAFAPTEFGTPGALPPLDSRPLERQARPVVVSAGSADPVTSDLHPESIGVFVSNRDGSEGWGLGPESQSSGPLTLDHYIDGQWRRCAAIPDNSQEAADPACARLGGVFDPQSGQSPTVFAAARIPLEYDDDPSNDDDFNAVAVGDATTYPDGVKGPLLAWYRHGRWSYDDKLGDMTAPTGALRSVVFTAPDDGWVSTDSGNPEVFHYDGKSWHLCGATADLACDEPGGVALIPRASTPFGVRIAMAGRRMFLYGTRQITGNGAASGAAGVLDGPLGTNAAPIILVRDAGQPCKAAGDAGCWRTTDGGYDPAAAGAAHGEFDGTTTAGRTPLSVVQNADGSYSGWAVGKFTIGSVATSLLHLTTGPDGSVTWQPWTKSDAAAQYLNFPAQAHAVQRNFSLVTVPGEDQAGSHALLAREDASNQQPVLEFNPVGDAGDGAWGLLATPFNTAGDAVGGRGRNDEADVTAMGSDGQGGAWIQAQTKGSTTGTGPTGAPYKPASLLYHYTTAVRKPVFDDVAHPIRDVVTGTATGPDGSLWVATAGATIYRYSRLTGWDSTRVKGWDPGNLVTRQSAARAIAIGPDGHGLLVGERGRIADITTTGALLDVQAGGQCVAAAVCGTTQDLRAAAVAPDGSAMVAGNGGAVLFRPAGGHDGFRAVPVPSTSAKTVFTGVALPRGDRAWLTTAAGQIFAGQYDGSGWSWHIENRDAHGAVLNLGPNDLKLGLNAIGVDADGHGYAVGLHGLVLERTGDAAQPWKRINTGFGEDLDSLVLTPNHGAVVGGWGGLVLTLDHGRFRVVRQSDLFDAEVNGRPSYPGRIVGLGVTPGSQDGQVEAWAILQVPFGDPAGSEADNRGPAPTTVLHYTSNPDDPLLSLAPRATPGIDSVEHVPGELSFAAFGKSDCQSTDRGFCLEDTGGKLFNDVISRSIVSGIAGRSSKDDGPSFALFTGDASDMAGQGSNGAYQTHAAYTPADESIVHERWIDQVVSPLTHAGVPLFGAIGGQDLAGARACPAAYGCAGTDKQGLTLPWRNAMAGMAAPWGNGAPYPTTASGYSFTAAPGTADDNGQGRTHYAFDVKRDDKLVARVVVLDSSSRSISTSDAQENPVEDQNSWLTTAMARPAGVPAIVLTNAPTYSYGPGTATDTATDATALETLLVQNNATVVVSGRIGWNALYWATAPGIHEPCPGGTYPEGPPSAVGTRNCAATTQSQTDQADAAYGSARDQAVKDLADALEPLNQSPPPVNLPKHIDPNAATGTVFSRPLPFVVASGAGGKFASDATSSNASDGYWHGYSVVRLIPAKDDKGKDTGQFNTVVEQRPVLDWIGITANGHTVAAGRTLQLDGFGREPVGIDQPMRYDDISSPAVTHRFDLLAADPRKPYMPMEGEPELPANIGTIDRQSGEITGGDGKYARTYAIARLTVDDKVATYPVVFEPRKSFRAQPIPAPIVLAQPATVVAHQAPPAIVLSQKPAALPPSAPPPPVPTPGNLNFTLPSPGAPPPLIQSTPVSTTPPPPPAPPPPPGTAAPTALQLSLTAPTLTLAPQSSVVPPPAPPIQPAPPGGARKEARQKQAAAAKNDESSGAEGADSKSESGDKSAMSRRTIRREEPYAFRAIADRDQPSAWARDALYGGGILVMSLLLAGGWTLAGPRARRRTPDIPAPAWQRTNRRR